MTPQEIILVEGTDQAANGLDPDQTGLKNLPSFNIGKLIEDANPVSARQIFSNDLFLSMERRDGRTTQGQTTVSTMVPPEPDDIQTSRLIMNERRRIINQQI